MSDGSIDAAGAQPPDGRAAADRPAPDAAPGHGPGTARPGPQPPKGKRLLSTLAFLGLLVLLVLYGLGTFRSTRDGAEAAEQASLPAPARTALAERVAVPLVEHAVGTIRSRRTVDVAPQVTARVLRVEAEPGRAVRQGELLLELDDRELSERASQARQVLAAAASAIVSAEQGKLQAIARLERSTQSVERVRHLAAERAATAESLEGVESEFRQAQASLAESDARLALVTAQREQASSRLSEAEIALGYARITAPLDGVVAERRVEAGDLALAGRTLFVLFDPTALRLEARVREGLIGRIREGETLEVAVPASDLLLSGRVSVVLPVAAAESRTFEVRVDLEPREGVRSGMFGRLRIVGGSREVVRVPAAALVRVGQLETVLVREGERWTRRLVTSGGRASSAASLEEVPAVEILSGLVGGETVGLAP